MKKIVFIICLILLFSCEGIKEGTVIKKEIEPSSFYIMMVPHTNWNGQFSTTYYTYIPMYDDEDYKVEIEGYTKKHKLVDQWIYVDKEMFDTIKVGDWYCIDNRCHVEPNKDVPK